MQSQLTLEQANIMDLLTRVKIMQLASQGYGISMMDFYILYLAHIGRTHPPRGSSTCNESLETA